MYTKTLTLTLKQLIKIILVNHGKGGLVGIIDRNNDKLKNALVNYYSFSQTEICL